MIRCLSYSAGALLLATVLGAFADAPTEERQRLPENLRQYEHINAIVVPDPKSPVTGFHHFYINSTGLETFRAAKDDVEYPAGTIIIGKVYQPEKTEDGAYKEGKLMAYTVMRKAPDDPATEETGDWEFTKFDAQRAPVKIDPVADCFHCHKPHAETDFVISEPLE